MQEEETGLPIAVVLDSPDLAKIAKVQRPREGERIGIKCVSSPADGDPRFVLVLDRAKPEPQPKKAKPPKEEPEPIDVDDEAEESVGATEEERLFIEQALMEDDHAIPAAAQTAPQNSDSALREIIDRQDEQMARQAEYIRELQGLLGMAIPLLRGSSEPEPLPCTAVEEPPTKTRVSPFAVAIFCISSLSLGLAGYLTYVLVLAVK